MGHVEKIDNSNIFHILVRQTQRMRRANILQKLFYFCE